MSTCAFSWLIVYGKREQEEKNEKEKENFCWKQENQLYQRTLHTEDGWLKAWINNFLFVDIMLWTCNNTTNTKKYKKKAAVEHRALLIGESSRETFSTFFSHIFACKKVFLNY